MKILCVADAVYPDHTGGISKSLLPEIEGLVRLGHKVTVVSRLQSNQPQSECRDGYELYRYFSISKKSFFYRLYPLFNFITLPDLISKLHHQHKITLPDLISKLHHQHKFDVAYVHNPFQLAGLNLVLSNLPCVYVYHASTYSEINLDTARGKYGKLKLIAGLVNFWVKSLESKVLTYSDKLIVRSDFMKNDMSKLYPNIDNEKVILLPLCVDTERFSFAENNNAARQKLGLPKQQPILLTVRRLVARMGIENLIFAMRIVVQKFPNVILLIGGDGYLKDDISLIIKQYNLEENVILIGFISEEILPIYYQAADLFVLPTSAYEGFGLVTIESLACGTPVMATPVGASPEILSKLEKKFLFDNNTSEAIAAGINLWLSQGFNSDIRQLCRKYCLDKFSQNRICYELEKIFLELAKTSKL